MDTRRLLLFSVPLLLLLFVPISLADNDTSSSGGSSGGSSSNSSSSSSSGGGSSYCYESEHLFFDNCTVTDNDTIQVQLNLTELADEVGFTEPDDVSNITAEVYTYSSLGSWTIDGFSYNTTSGLWWLDLFVPLYASSDEWWIRDVEVLLADGTSIKIRETAGFAVNSTNPDNSPPNVFDVYISANETNDNSTLRVYVNATDDLSGINSITAYFIQEDWLANICEYEEDCSDAIEGFITGRWSRASSCDNGDPTAMIMNATDFTYNSTSELWASELYIPANTTNGTWAFEAIEVSDNVGRDFSCYGECEEDGVWYWLMYDIPRDANLIINSSMSYEDALSCVSSSSSSGSSTCSAGSGGYGDIECNGTNCSMTVTIDAGWNLIGVPMDLENESIEAVFGNLTENITVIYGYAPDTNWTVWRPGNETNDSLTELEEGRGYWLNMTDNATLTIRGTVLNITSEPPNPPNITRTYELSEGWNLVGKYGMNVLGVYDVFRSVSDKYSSIWGYGDRSYYLAQFYYPVFPGDGYWIYMRSDGTLEAIDGPVDTIDSTCEEVGSGE